PDRPVVQPIADFVRCANGAVGIELDPLGVSQLQRPAGRHQRAEHVAKRVAILTRHSSLVTRHFFCAASAAIAGGNSNAFGSIGSKLTEITVVSCSSPIMR